MTAKHTTESAARPSRRHFLALGATAVAAGLAGCITGRTPFSIRAADEHTVTVTEDVRVPADTRLVVTNELGSLAGLGPREQADDDSFRGIRITDSEDDAVHVTATVRTRKARRELEKITLHVDHADGVLTVEPRVRTDGLLTTVKA
ncbi:hypothetical protein [Haloarchaeobius amylolyticus]|uniref:hypothetical protein n=1 Tax=Haloarchaeobius amylolyticus TaxID=1198296 RepID=UPI00226E1778|nr:hypothetical protein [Haloarchaeobius amylolyticus]